METKEIDLALLCRCFRGAEKELGRNLKDISRQIAEKMGGGLSKTAAQKVAQNFIDTHSVGQKYRDAVIEAAIAFFVDHRETILEYYAREPALVSYLSSLLSKYRPDQVISHADPLANWKKSSIADDDVHKIFSSGMYQIFRRHKSVVPNPETPPDGESLDNIIVTELVYIDAKARRCVLVGPDGLVYHGSLHINDRKVAFLLLERELLHDSFDYRYYCVKLDGRMPFYSALTIRTGDVSYRPIASSCLVAYVSRSKNRLLYDALTALLNAGPRTTRLESSSIIFDYIVPAPSDAQQPGHVLPPRSTKYLRDFPFLLAMAKKIYDGHSPFQAPLRALTHSDITLLIQELEAAELGIFSFSGRTDGLTAPPITDQGES